MSPATRLRSAWSRAGSTRRPTVGSCWPTWPPGATASSRSTTPCATRRWFSAWRSCGSSRAGTSWRTCSAPEDPMTAPAEPTTGTIYDIGYRHYDGPRLGRRGAVTAIFSAGLRAVFGMGRSARSKIVPWGLVMLGLTPAAVAVAIRVLVGDIVELYSYDNYLWGIGALFTIFVAAQAPELVVNDMRHRVLPLYFSRPIRRLDYVAAKLAA